MAGPGRNEPCACGSGKKTKRCCGQRRGPCEEQLARVFLEQQATEAAFDLVALEQHEVHALVDEVAELPSRYDALLFPLPRLASPALEPLRSAIGAENLDAITHALPRAVVGHDTPVLRARLARAVLALRDAGRLGRGLAAAALIDLAAPEGEGTLVPASLIQALAVDCGAVRTASGLVVAR